MCQTLLGSVGKSKVKTAGVLVGQVHVMMRGRISRVVDVEDHVFPPSGKVY